MNKYKYSQYWRYDSLHYLFTINIKILVYLFNERHVIKYWLESQLRLNILWASTDKQIFTALALCFLRYITLFAINIDSSVYLFPENQSDLYYLFIAIRAINVWAANHSSGGGATPPANASAVARWRRRPITKRDSDAGRRHSIPRGNGGGDDGGGLWDNATQRDVFDSPVTTNITRSASHVCLNSDNRGSVWVLYTTVKDG
jgi:hypothetical protein